MGAATEIVVEELTKAFIGTNNDVTLVDIADADRLPNSLLRQFFPKGSSFSDVSDDILQDVVNLINNRSRKRLGFRTPSEMLAKFFLNFCCTCIDNLQFKKYNS